MKKDKYFVDQDIRKAETLPPDAFVSKEFLDTEIKKIFKKEWLAVLQLNAADLKLPGSRVPFELLEQKLLFIRQIHGKQDVKCLSNVCTHQGNLLVDNSEVGYDIFTCRLHGRIFSLDGKCISHWPDADLCPADNLKEVAVSNNGIFTMVNFLGNRESDVEIVQVKEILSKFPLANAERTELKASERVLDGNWKLHVRNYLDYTHVPTIHRESLMSKIDFGSYKTNVFVNCVGQIVRAKDSKYGIGLNGLHAELHGQFAIWIFVWPNLALNIYPFGLSVNSWEPVMNDSAKTRMRWACYVWDRAKYELRDEIWGLTRVDKEDIEYIAKMQAGMNSGQLSRTAFSPKYEQATHWFERKIYESIFEK
ncbi:hypothetical protein A2662_01590 [Candidatus Giovannonibacteria bacterium RIFCSPHIGHO2_01_FULL_45_33]|uniref:Rieske domain-containing protein n=1 Tax=Candidatus Giovannonibacteria bacterium RIFCSPLOWO2_01_FULL_45_34 TaxID=1798351 RepID=A0A1F5X0J3_9BACT|nr:MAG: hypothetical protein A2662_01590 [Candidatus Giovannonibacteria bacterium RIFCSPHIGHO2_01_FULL_45_33]OGF70722.1 MAG: hypothetical protein A3C73_03050 [Candidatus Giovannonibacteria bacterium RIFCSPHIGHO2_02_FULL_44_11]OGF81415.1 MAG: hypothetical protein A2930_01305 [Candidatus Giovannonibacteria bacterium RIFCSPLOWO2_01_FULL_45_34]